MGINLNPYVSFRNNAKQALEFYQSVLGGELTMSTFADFEASQDPAERDLIMHGQLEAPGGLVLMAADTPSTMEHTPGNNITISLSGDDGDTLRRFYEKLSQGGQQTMPLGPVPWGEAFGMCVDKFGIQWMVNIGTP